MKMYLKGEFYEDTDVRSSSVFAESEGQKDYSYVPESITEVCFKDLSGELN